MEESDSPHLRACLLATGINSASTVMVSFLFMFFLYTYMYNRFGHLTEAIRDGFMLLIRRETTASPTTIVETARPVGQGSAGPG